MNVRIGKPLDEEQKLAVMQMIAGHLPIIPGKTVNNTMLEITAGCDLYTGGEKKELIFVDMRILGTAPAECKDEFIKTLAEGFEKLLNIPGSNLYFNIIDMPNWGTGMGLASAK